MQSNYSLILNWIQDCAGRLKSKLNSHTPTVIFWGPTWPSNGMDAHTQYKKPPWNQALLRNQLTHVKAEIFFHLRQLKSVSEEKILKCVWSAHISQAMPVLQLSAWSDNVGHFSSYKPRNVTSMLLCIYISHFPSLSDQSCNISHRHFCSPRRSLHLALRSAGARITWRWILDCVKFSLLCCWNGQSWSVSCWSSTWSRMH